MSLGHGRDQVTSDSRSCTPGRDRAPDIVDLVRQMAGIGELPLAPTPYEVIYTKEKLRLLKYRPEQPRFGTPILFVYSLINRYYILDFLPGRSLIAFLLEQGFSVYCIDWGRTGPEDRDLSWDYYLDRYIAHCVRRTLQDAGTRELTFYGYCMGGTMALAYAALAPDGLRSFVAQAVPVDFHDKGLLSRWTRPEFFNVDAMVDAHGNIPVALMEGAFRWMDPVWSMQKWGTFFEKIGDEEFATLFLSMEKWAGDNVPFPGEAYRQYIKDCYQSNRFMKGRMMVRGRRVDLSRIRCPLLNIMAAKDHIVPPESSEVLAELVGSQDKTTLRFDCGHIGLVASSRARRLFWPKVADWLVERSELL